MAGVGIRRDRSAFRIAAAYDRAINDYPANREADVVLSDGSTVHVRPVRADDVDAVHELFRGLSVDSRTFRFFSAGTDLRAAARTTVDVDYAARYGLVALRGADERVVGQGIYIGEPSGEAEVAFAVADELQGRGLGTLLLAHLAEVAEDNGMWTFVAEVMPENHRMIEVFRESGLPLEISSLPGTIRVEMPTSLSPEAVERFEHRDRLAARAAVRHFLAPRSVAVVGASRTRDTVGGAIFHNLLESDFDGPVYPVNPASDVVQSVRAYGSVAEVPDEIELAVVAVPAAAVIEVAKQCAEKGVPALVVISAGFSETGADGAELERALLEVCRDSGMRLLGPNCLGVLNTVPGATLNATFAPGAPPPGDIGFVTQSGALGLGLIDLAADRAVGMSSFASIGNRADLTANDLLDYWETDESTNVSLLYIESFSDARRFSRGARRIGRHKPIVVVKSGRSTAGVRATSSHTGAMLAASDLTADALFSQAGVIRTESLAELLDVASLLSNQPLPKGNRVGIVTNAGGPGIMCADACEAAGLEVPEIPESVRDSMRAFLPPEAGLSNPVDMIATASADAYRRAIGVLAGWSGIDSLIVIFIRPLLTRAEDVAVAVREAADELERPIPIQAVFMSARDREAIVRDGGIPTHLYPEDAARALGRVIGHVRWRAQPERPVPRFADARGDEAAAVIADELAAGRKRLGMSERARLLDCYGIAFPAWELAGDARAAGAAAERIGGPVALKAEGPAIVHKTEIGAVLTGLTGADEVAAAASEMDGGLERAGVERDSFLVQAMAADGVELLAGIVADPVFGPVFACGAGGVHAELFKDVQVRICPITEVDAEEMLRALAVFPMLTGYRGAPAADLAALVELLLRMSAMVEAHSEIAELEFNPVIAGPDGATAVDARVVLDHPRPRRSWPRTWS